LNSLLICTNNWAPKLAKGILLLIIIFVMIGIDVDELSFEVNFQIFCFLPLDAHNFLDRLDNVERGSVLPEFSSFYLGLI
jgi:hypothetical protein